MSLYALLIVCMGTATVMEEIIGKDEVARHIYGAWWFAALWALTASLSAVCLLLRKVQHSPAVMLLHVSFLVILTGAALTRVFSEQGTIHLRTGQWTSAYVHDNGESASLPFAVRLDTFCIDHYPGTDAVMDYRSRISVKHGRHKETLTVAMNDIGKAYGYRLCQSSYDSDGHGTHLLVSRDPYGITVTYTGYLLLLAGWLFTLTSGKTRLRQLYRTATRGGAVLLATVLCTTQAHATEVNKDIADEMGRVAVLYQGRICPLNTAATDFVVKLCGSNTWHGRSANEIFLGWTIYYTEWESQKIIKVKNVDVQRMLGIDGEWACVNDFYTAQHTYKLHGKADDTSLPSSLRKAIRETDEKIQVVTMFYNGEMLRIFPLKHDGKLTWHTPGSTSLPRGVGRAEFLFINHVMDYLVQQILVDDTARAKELIAKIRYYQQEKAGAMLPSAARMRAETIHNTLLSARWPVMLSLTLSLCLCLMCFLARPRRLLRCCHHAFAVLLFCYLSMLLGLRWWVSGHVPMSNGLETMLLTAWSAMLLTISVMRRWHVVTALGPVVASLCWLVAMIASGSPRVTPLVPVLQSPLLSLHVALVIMSYALLSVIALISVRCLTLRQRHHGEELTRLTALSRLMLYPAVSLLSLGIFVGAVWANISWGSYWSWDPKETWALITMMIYAAPLHRSWRWPNAQERHYHLYVLLAFLTVLMTYFGVNYFLSGMHSYA